jgi:F-type H+-transporting ATPase subunit epsilon
MSKLQFQLVTPERTVLNEELDSLSCPTTLGQITILPGHVPLVATLVAGELTAKNEGKEHNIAITGGFIEVRPNNQIVALADAAEHHYEIDVQKTEQAVRRAQTAMKETKMSSEEYAKVAASLNQSLARLNIARKHSHRRGSPITGQGTLNE